MKRTLLALCTLALAAAPVLAGPVYLPGAIHVTDGAYVRSTELWVTNPDTAVRGLASAILAELETELPRLDGLAGEFLQSGLMRVQLYELALGVCAAERRRGHPAGFWWTSPARLCAPR